MNVQDLETKYYISEERINKLESLGLLDRIKLKNDKREFNDQDIQDIMDMLSLIDLGIDGDDLVRFYNCQSSQWQILKKARLTILEYIHDYQKKLDKIDYLIYQRRS